MILCDVRGDHDGAEKAFREAIGINPRHAMAHYKLGVILRNVKRDYDGAEDEFRDAIKHDSRHADAHYELGVILCDVRQNYGGAVKEFRAAIDIAPQFANAHYELAAFSTREPWIPPGRRGRTGTRSSLIRTTRMLTVTSGTSCNQGRFAECFRCCGGATSWGASCLCGSTRRRNG